MRIFVFFVALFISASLWAKPLTDIAPEALLTANQQNLLILDVRSSEEYARGHVPGAMHIPHRELGQRLQELKPWANKSVVVYCESGYRANIAASLLQQQGFNDVSHLLGDMREWRRSGREIAF